MKRLSVLALTLSVSLVGILSLAALRAQSPATRWEYLRLGEVHRSTPTGTPRWALEGCQAVAADWQCREFTPPQDNSVGQTRREALFRLGQEGWELASIVPPDPASYQTTYWFKRPATQ